METSAVKSDHEIFKAVLHHYFGLSAHLDVKEEDLVRILSNPDLIAWKGWEFFYPDEEDDQVPKVDAKSLAAILMKREVKRKRKDECEVQAFRAINSIYYEGTEASLEEFFILSHENSRQKKRPPEVTQSSQPKKISPVAVAKVTQNDDNDTSRYLSLHTSDKDRPYDSAICDEQYNETLTSDQRLEPEIKDIHQNELKTGVFSADSQSKKRPLKLNNDQLIVLLKDQEVREFLLADETYKKTLSKLDKRTKEKIDTNIINHIKHVLDPLKSSEQNKKARLLTDPKKSKPKRPDSKLRNREILRIFVVKLLKLAKEENYLLTDVEKGRLQEIKKFLDKECKSLGENLKENANISDSESTKECRLQQFQERTNQK